MKRFILIFLLFFGLRLWSQISITETNGITHFIQTLADFSENIPHEKVYLHFDNTSYFQGDNIWFKCYVVTSGLNQLNSLSKTLYVELLNPGGEIINKRVLRIEDGQCHGDFSLNHQPFYSGFYEIRAYTKYMLNFGEELVFSRLLPVFNRPKKEGNFEEKKMLRYGMYGPVGNYPMKRQRPEKGKNVNLRFFPEGGNMVQGVASRIAFEATDEAGSPIEITGIVMDEAKQELNRISTLHEGKGVFSYTPLEGKRKAIAEVEYSGKKYRFDLPQGLPQGIAMEVDNLTHSDKIEITLRKSENTHAETLGLVVLTSGTLQSYVSNINFANDRNEVSFKIDKTDFPSGVSQIVLFDAKGEIICDRLIFTGRNDDRLDIKIKTNKSVYNPHELVEMEFSITDLEANSIQTSFSLSVRDGDNEVENNRNVLTDLLLMSEIKGYVRDPSYYFEACDDIHRTALDALLMVQGWRRYTWEQMTNGLESFEIQYPAEQGIETNGRIVSAIRQIPKPGIDVKLVLYKMEEDADGGISFVEDFVTDGEGRFSFVSDVDGRWNMILSAMEKGKQKDHRILLDRVIDLHPRRYRYADLQVSVAENYNENITDEEISDEPEDNSYSSFIAYRDSIVKLGIDKKVHNLPEVTIKTKRNTNAQDIFYNRSTSVAYYDVASELDDIYDRGKFVGKDFHEMMVNMNNDFSKTYFRATEYLWYKRQCVPRIPILIPKIPIFVINYERTDQLMSYFNYQNINLNAIKSIYVNEHESVIRQWADSRIDEPYNYFNCVVFIETHPDWKPVNEGSKGVRKTWLEGYSPLKEFYSPNYSQLSPEPDYRRTLYWNPAVTTDENGLAKINFYNNSSCRNFSISAETVSSQGMIGIYRNK